MAEALIDWIASEYGCLGVLAAVVGTVWGTVAMRLVGDAAGFDMAEWSGD